MEIFLSNDYLLGFIFDTINTKIKKLFLSNKNLPENELTNDKRQRWFHIYLM